MSPERISPPDAFRAQIFWGSLLRVSDISGCGTYFASAGSPPQPLDSAAIRLEFFPQETTMTKKIFAALLLTGSLMVAACNTVEGAGKDVQSAGAAVEDAAK
jgi:predicted small secreted protein